MWPDRWLRAVWAKLRPPAQTQPRDAVDAHLDDLERRQHEIDARLRMLQVQANLRGGEEQ